MAVLFPAWVFLGPDPVSFSNSSLMFNSIGICIRPGIFRFSLLVFCRKVLCEAKHEMQSVFKFSDVPPVEASSGQEQYYVRSAWHFEECNWEGSKQSDVPLGRGIWWPGAVLCQVSLTFGKPLGQGDTPSDIPPSRGVWWPRAVLCQVSLTFGKPLGQGYIQSLLLLL